MYVIIFFILLSCIATRVVAAKDDSDTEQTQPGVIQTDQFEEVSHGIYVRFGKHLEISKASVDEIANTGFIIGSRSIAIVDPGGSVAAVRVMYQAIRNISPLPISHVIVTHVHPDHSLGLLAFTDSTKALWLPDDSPGNLQAADWQAPLLMGHPALWGSLLQNAIFFRDNFTETLKDNDLQSLLSNLPPESPMQSSQHIQTIDLGQRQLTLTPQRTAHSNADLTVFDSNTKTLWAGDLLVSQRLPALDGSLNGWLGVLETLENELENNQPVTVIPGHGHLQTFSTIAKPQHSYLTRLRKITRQAIRQGQSLSGFLSTEWPWPQTRWKLFEAQHRRNASRAYTELEWE